MSEKNNVSEYNYEYAIIAVVGLLAVAGILFFVLHGKATPPEDGDIGNVDIGAEVIGALHKIKTAQDQFVLSITRPINGRERPCYASNLYDLYYDYAKKNGVPPVGLSKEIIESTTPEKDYLGYYFMTLERDSEGEKIPITRGYAVCAFPVEYSEATRYTYLLHRLDMKWAIYRRDLAGTRIITRCPSPEELENEWEKVAE